MRITNVFDRNDAADAVDWSAGRTLGLAVKPDDSVIWVATVTRADFPKGTKSIALLKRSTNGGVSFGPYSIVVDLFGAPPNDNGVEGPMLLYDPRVGRLHMMLFSNVGLPPTDQGYASAISAPTIWTYSDDDGVTWSTPAELFFPGKFNYFPSGGGGHYDPATGMLIFGCCGRDGTAASGRKHSPFALVSATGLPGSWEARAFVDANTDQGENKMIADGGAWWCLTRIEAAQPRRLYRSTDQGQSWTRVLSAFPLPQFGLNLGFTVTNIGGVPTWLYTSAVRDQSEFTQGININTPRTRGRLLASRDRGRSWAEVATLTHAAGAEATRFIGYSDVQATAANIYVAYEANTYRQINLAIISKAELA